MDSQDSIAVWIEEVKQGHAEAADALWARYFPDLVDVARRRLFPGMRQVADEEDVASSAMGSFFRAAREGRLEELCDREGLWRLLARMTHRKAVDLLRTQMRLKRSRRRTLGEDQTGTSGLGEIAHGPLEADLAAMVCEEYLRLLDKLDDSHLRAIAEAKMQGFSNQEIADQIHCSLRTVERRLQVIRRTWEHYAGEP